MNTDEMAGLSATTRYELSREKIKEYAEALGDEQPYYLDESAAEQAGLGGIVAPPTAVSILVLKPVEKLLAKAEIPTDGLLHGEQEYNWFQPLRPGTYTMTASIERFLTRSTMAFLYVTAAIVDDAGEAVAEGKSNFIIRGWEE